MRLRPRQAWCVYIFLLCCSVYVRLLQYLWAKPSSLKPKLKQIFIYFAETSKASFSEMLEISFCALLEQRQEQQRKSSLRVGQRAPRRIPSSRCPCQTQPWQGQRSGSGTRHSGILNNFKLMLFLYSNTSMTYVLH